MFVETPGVIIFFAGFPDRLLSKAHTMTHIFLNVWESVHEEIDSITFYTILQRATTMMIKSFFLLLVLAFSISTAFGQYNIVSRNDHHRRHRRELQQAAATATSPSASPQVLSFDGDLDRIVNLALERANNNNNNKVETTSASPSTTPTASPSLSPAPSVSAAPSLTPVHSPNTCPGAILNRLAIYEWKYTIETVPNANIDSVIGEVEEILQERLIPRLLECNNPNAVNGTVVAIDGTFPRDTVSLDSTFVL